MRQGQELDGDEGEDVGHVFENGKLARKEALGGPAASFVPQPPGVRSSVGGLAVAGALDSFRDLRLVWSY